MIYEKFLNNLAEKIGVEINGNAPYDPVIHNNAVYRRIFFDGRLGLGESYMDGFWDCEQLDEFVYRIFTSDLRINKIWKHYKLAFLAGLFNRQNNKDSLEVARLHYNLNNELYVNMLGESMAYTCAYWKDKQTLDDAQFEKYDLICRKLHLKENEYLLDLGCGFGGFAKYAADNYGCRVVGVNLAEEQVRFAKEWCRKLPVEIHCCDYRNFEAYNHQRQKFDKVAAIGLCEHIGPKNYQKWLKLIHGQMKDGGLLLIQTIGTNTSQQYCDPWFNKYIFPNGVIPSVFQLGQAFEGLFTLEDWHNFGTDYHKTLLHWWKEFDNYWKNKMIGQTGRMTPEQKRFYRMWRYYLLSVSGSFKARVTQLWQIVLSKDKYLDAYSSIR